MYFKFMRKNCKKMLTELSDYVNIFLACDAHVQCASGSVVEHLLAKEGVAGSIPVSRSVRQQKGLPNGKSFFVIREVRGTSRNPTASQFGFDFSGR